MNSKKRTDLPPELPDDESTYMGFVDNDISSLSLSRAWLLPGSDEESFEQLITRNAAPPPASPAPPRPKGSAR